MGVGSDDIGRAEGWLGGVSAASKRCPIRIGVGLDGVEVWANEVAKFSAAILSWQTTIGEGFDAVGARPISVELVRKALVLHESNMDGLGRVIRCSRPCYGSASRQNYQDRHVEHLSPDRLDSPESAA